MRATLLCLLVLSLIIALGGCKNKTTEPDVNLPVVETKEITQVDLALPSVFFTVLSAGASPITQLTVCWGESQHPDLNGEHHNFSASESDDPYMMGMTFYGLKPGATYYVRTYAKNAHGEIWSNEVSFTMLPMLWDIIEMGTSSNLTRVYFHNENLGWICGSQGLIRKSTDGGTTWTSVSSGTSAYLADMQWLDQNNAWIAGNNNTVLKTSNGGNSWQIVNTGLTPASEYSAVHFENQLTGYLMTIYGAIYKTVDGGTSWSQIRNEGQWTFRDLWSQGEKIIIAGQGLRISNNGGSTWNSNLVLDHDYGQILYREPGTLWVVGEGSSGDGATYKSDDLGTTWIRINNKIRHSINSVCLAPGSQKLWLVGTYGTIFASQDDGLHWAINYNLINSTMFKSVCAVSESKVWIVGGSGTLLRLKTGGVKRIKK